MLSDVQFRAIVDNLPVMVWRAGADSQYDYFNSTWLQFTGRTMAQEAGGGHLAGVHPNDVQRLKDTFHTAFDKREPFEITYRLRRNDGEYRWVNDHGTPIVHLNATFGGFVGSCIDVTDKVAGKALSKITSTLLHNQMIHRRREEFLDRILESMEFPFFSIDTQYHFVFFNSSYKKKVKSLFGVDIKNGMNILDCYDIPEDRANIKACLDECMTGKSLAVSDNGENSPGERRTVLVTYNPVWGKDGRVIGASVFTQHFACEVIAKKETVKDEEQCRHDVAHEQRVYEYQRRSALMNDYLEYRLADPVFQNMAKGMGIVVGAGPYCCAVFRLIGPTLDASTKQECVHFRILDQLQEKAGGIVWQTTNGIGFISQLNGDIKKSHQEAMSGMNDLMIMLRQGYPDVRIVGGISFSTAWSAALPELYEQAMAAAEFGPAVCQDREVIAWSDLGWVQFLVKDLQSKHTRQFVFEQLGPLLQMKRKESGMVLLDTLGVILTEESMETVAKIMQVHPQTVRYRRRLIEKMLGNRIDSKEKATNLLIAVKILALQKKAAE